MTTVAVLAEPPRPGRAFPALTPSPLTESEAAALYAAAMGDVCAAVEASGAELLVNYRETDAGDDESAVRDALEGALSDPSAARYEVQVGSTPSARVGNTVTHLLEREEVRTAAAVTPATALLARSDIDSAAMKLRSSDVVLGPTTDGRVYYAGFAAPIDFADALATPAVETLVDRALAADLSVDFLPTLPVIETPADLRTVVPQMRARRAAGRRVPERTADALADLGLAVEDRDGEVVLRRE
ncbi:MAG: hypothetical protein ABEJ89_04095 [Haloarculaceae archaeon]